MPSRLLFLLLLSIPVSAEPLFRLFDCAISCPELPSGPGKPGLHHTVENGNIIFKGYNLGPAGGPGGRAGYIPMFHHDSYVIGWWAFDAGGGYADWDGGVVSWSLGSDLTPEPQDLELYGAENFPIAMNSKGQFIGQQYPYYFSGFYYYADGPYNIYYLNDEFLLHSVADGEKWVDQICITCLRLVSINDYGQAFTAGHRFLLSPIGLPEPSSILLVGLGLLLCARRLSRN